MKSHIELVFALILWTYSSYYFSSKNSWCFLCICIKPFIRWQCNDVFFVYIAFNFLIGIHFISVKCIHFECRIRFSFVSHSLFLFHFEWNSKWISYIFTSSINYSKQTFRLIFYFFRKVHKSDVIWKWFIKPENKHAI